MSSISRFANHTLKAAQGGFTARVPYSTGRRVLSSTQHYQPPQRCLHQQQPSDISVMVSKSNDPYFNLALEDWIVDNYSFETKNLMLLWRNNPTVVLGRNQIVWLECDPGFMKEKGVNLVRRRSGGGTVYHDLGNANVTFFTARNRHDEDKQKNSEAMVQALRDGFSVDASISERNDLFLQDCKISGSAYKLGSRTAFHHCTLLLDADVDTLNTCLRPMHPNIETKAIPSERSKVTTISGTIGRKISFEEFSKKMMVAFTEKYGLENTVELVDPANETRFPGLSKFSDELRSEKWTLGKTPRFAHTVEVNEGPYEMSVELLVRHGVIEEVTLNVNSALDNVSVLLENIVKDCLEGSLLSEVSIREEFESLLADLAANDTLRPPLEALADQVPRQYQLL